MATNTAGSSARVYHQAQTHYLDAALNITNMAVGASFKLGTLPAGAVIKGGGVGVTTAFNGGTNNSIGAGFTSGGVTLVANVAGLATLGRTDLTAIAAVSAVSVDTDVYITSGITGTPPTTGAATVWLEYIVPSSALV